MQFTINFALSLSKGTRGLRRACKESVQTVRQRNQEKLDLFGAFSSLMTHLSERAVPRNTRELTG